MDDGIVVQTKKQNDIQTKETQRTANTKPRQVVSQKATVWLVQVSQNCRSPQHHLKL